jgi:nitrogen permease regulator 2-like protein
MRPGKTVFEWMQDHDVRSPGIDVRKFASFGVLKVRIFYLHKNVKRGQLSPISGAGLPPPRTSLASTPH